MFGIRFIGEHGDISTILVFIELTNIRTNERNSQWIQIKDRRVEEHYRA